MVEVTFQLIEGLERGQVFSNLPVPLTIGREDDNGICLNDERVSRFHVKIQEDGGRVILTDLDSTNGTRVNGNPVQIRVLRIGDQLTIGRCLLVYGSREAIAAYAVESEKRDRTLADVSERTLVEDSQFPLDEDSQFPLDEVDDDQSAPADDVVDSGDADSSPEELFPAGAPPIPTGLRPIHRAEVSDLLSYAHEQIRFVLQNSIEEIHNGRMRIMRVPAQDWHRVLQLEMDLAAALRRLADPDE